MLVLCQVATNKCIILLLACVFLCQGVEAEGGGVPSDRVRWLELDQ